MDSMSDTTEHYTICLADVIDWLMCVLFICMLFCECIILILGFVADLDVGIRKMALRDMRLVGFVKRKRL